MYRAPKRRLRVRSASGFQQQQADSQVAAQHVDVLYWEILLCDDTFTTDFIFTSRLQLHYAPAVFRCQ
jgi:hypothetical protein